MAIIFSKKLVYAYCIEFVTGGCIVSSPNAVCVTTLPCEILITILFVFTSIQCYIVLLDTLVND